MIAFWVVMALGSVVFSFVQGWYLGQERGYRQGLRTAARICVESNTDPRPAFASWLNEVDEVRR